MPDPAAGMTADEAEALKGARVLVVEDEMMAASMLEIVLGDAGCIVVGPAATVPDALALAANGPLDAAILDVNLGGEPIFPLADILAGRRVPFVFVTGYGVNGVNGERYAGVPVVQKPYDDEEMVEAVARLIVRRPAG